MREALGVPYEPGNHCIFYAVQDANIYFNKRGLTESERNKYQKERQRRVNLFKAISGRTEGKGGRFIVSVPMVLTKLKNYNIEPKEIVCTKDTTEVFAGKNFVRQAGILVRGVDQGEATIELPALFFIEGSEKTKTGHVWFCSDEKKFDEEYNKHIGEGDGIAVVIPLEKNELKD